MKEVTILLTLAILLLTACSPVSTPTDQADTVQDATTVAEIVSATQTAMSPVIAATSITNSSTLSTNFENAAPVAIQLMVGVLKLEETDLAITASQAESFVTVLNFLKDLSTNTAATQEQFDALVEQAQSILTTEQIAAIATMQITQETAMSLLQEQRGDVGTPPQENGNPPQGDMPQGTPPAGGPGGLPPNANSMGTPPADGMQPNMNFIPPQWIDMLIQLMESKTASS